MFFLLTEAEKPLGSVLFVFFVYFYFFCLFTFKVEFSIYFQVLIMILSFKIHYRLAGGPCQAPHRLSVGEKSNGHAGQGWAWPRGSSVTPAARSMSILPSATHPCSCRQQEVPPYPKKLVVHLSPFWNVPKRQLQLVHLSFILKKHSNRPTPKKKKILPTYVRAACISYTYDTWYASCFINAIWYIQI